MRSRIVPIGNSQGVRIPKPLLEEAGLHGEVELSVQGDAVLIRPAHGHRAGWAAAFEEMAVRGDDGLLDDDPALTSWDQEEWEW